MVINPQIKPFARPAFPGKFSLAYLGAALLFLLGIALRLLYIEYPPLDFLTARQLRSAIIARGMYCAMTPCADEFHRQVAVWMWKGEDVYEPQLNERLVATTYLLLGGEKLWIFRVLSASYWFVGALVVFLLARRWTGPEPALVALAFFAVPYFPVMNGRSYQPEPFMIMWILLAVFFLQQWAETQRWRTAILSGVLGGVAILVKVMAVFPILCVFGLLAVDLFGLKRLFSNKQVWIIGLTFVVIPSIYYFGMIGTRSSGFFGFWTQAMAHKLLEPAFYLQWLTWLHNLIGLLPILLALAGIIFLPARGRLVVSGWIVGYLIYTAFLPVQVSTHTYYSLILVPGLALGFTGIAYLFFQKLAFQAWNYRLFFGGIALLAVAYPAWITRSLIASQNEGIDQEVQGWKRLSDELPGDGRMIGLTHDYGYRIRYLGWQLIGTWPNSWDFSLGAEANPEQEGFEQQFTELTSGYRYFVITDFTDYEAQPDLKNYLNQYYPIVQSGDGYIVFDLGNRMEKSP